MEKHQRTIKLVNAKLIFPNKFNRMSRHDFLNIVATKGDMMMVKEKTAFENIADFNDKVLGDSSDIMVEVIGKDKILAAALNPSYKMPKGLTAWQKETWKEIH